MEASSYRSQVWLFRYYFRVSKVFEFFPQQESVIIIQRRSGVSNQLAGNKSHLSSSFFKESDWKVRNSSEATSAKLLWLFLPVTVFAACPALVVWRGASAASSLFNSIEYKSAYLLVQPEGARHRGSCRPFCRQHLLRSDNRQIPKLN